MPEIDLDKEKPCEICKKTDCTEPCYFISLIVGSPKALQESSKDIDFDRLSVHKLDYKDALTELIRVEQTLLKQSTITLSDKMSLQERAVKCLSKHFDGRQIQALLGLSERTYYRRKAS